MGIFDKYQDTGSDEFADSWSPSDIGDKIVGTISKVSERDTKYGAKVVVTFDNATFVQEGAEKSAAELEWWIRAENAKGNPTQPLVALQEAGADTGRGVTVELDELRDVGKGNPMKVYKVTVHDKLDNDPFA